MERKIVVIVWASILAIGVVIIFTGPEWLGRWIAATALIVFWWEWMQQFRR